MERGAGWRGVGAWHADEARGALLDHRAAPQGAGPSKEFALLARKPDVFRAPSNLPDHGTARHVLRGRDAPRLGAARESQVMGRHFEEGCRQFALERGDAVFGEIPRTERQGW
jgi:hypothetical protein